MVAPLRTVEIPGLREALIREQELRDLPFLDLPEDIAGIPVRVFTLRDLIALDLMKNAHVVRYRFESEIERITQAQQFLWFMSAGYRVPRGWLDYLWMCARRERFSRRVMRMNSKAVFDGIDHYLAEAFYDNPYGGEGGGAALKASYAVYLIDQLCAAGYSWSEREILDMPIKRLWQYLRISMKRLDPKAPITNRSDKLANDYIAQRNAARAAEREKEAHRA